MATSDRNNRARLDFLEWEASNRPRRHALRLCGLVALGYAYPIFLSALSFALAAAMLAMLPLTFGSPIELMVVYGMALVGSLALTAAVLRTFAVSLPVPDGTELLPGEAQPLRAFVEEVRRTIGGPPIHHIHITTDLNAAVAQRRRFGFWGKRTNYLIIGLSMLVALTPEQLAVVLTHEFGHLSGRHNSFGAWIYRVHRTWESLAAPFKAASKARWLLMGWFVRWYGTYFAISTLALRRRHEYEADVYSAQLKGAQGVGSALLAMDWFGYRNEKNLWPTVIREAGHDPLPPPDIFGRMARLWTEEPSTEMIQTWRRSELLRRTPITADHPCLIDRLDAIGCRAMLESRSESCLAPGASARQEVETSALPLLDDVRDRIWNNANALWKAMAMGRWRATHAFARQAIEKSKKSPVTDANPAEAEWEKIRVEADYAPPQRAAQLLREFIFNFPDHAAANFALGGLLLVQDDDKAADYFEKAMSNGSDFIAPSLQLLLDHYREAGRDLEADPIRMRLEEHERAIVRSRKERLKVSRRDRFLQHDLSSDDVASIRRILFRYPRIQSAYLGRKQVKLFSDKPSYVLGVTRRAHLLEDNRRADKVLINHLSCEISHPCAVVILGRTSARLRSRLVQVCPSPVYWAAD